MKICTLYSGSKGNAAFLRLSDTEILVDAGKNAKCLCQGLRDVGTDIENIRAILLTHEHTDHVAALGVLLKHHPLPVHLPRASADKLTKTAPEHVKNCFIPHPPSFSGNIEGISFASFPTPHDSAASVGYRFSFEEKGATHTVGYATDVGHLSREVMEGLLGCEAAVIESNHDVDMLTEGPYPYDLKRRILSRYGHLSNADCGALATELVRGGTKRLLLAHLSEQNNDPELVFSELSAILAGLDVQIAVASPTDPTWLIDEKEMALC